MGALLCKRHASPNHKQPAPNGAINHKQPVNLTYATEKWAVAEAAADELL